MAADAIRVGRPEALALRLARHNLGARLAPGRGPAAAVVGLQDTPPHAAGIALAARVEDASTADLDGLVIVPSLRGAPMAVAPEDLPLFTTALDPPDEQAAQALLQTAAGTLGEMPALEALDRVSAAEADALAGGPLERDAFHEALRKRLPATLLPFCRGCRSHHVHPSLWRASGVRGVLSIAGREGRTAVFALPPQVPSRADPGAELARRFLSAYTPATPALFAGWAGIHRRHADALWSRAGELAEVELEGARRWMIAEDVVAVLDASGRASGVRLLPGHDPYLAQRDRELLVPDAGLRKRIWRALGNPGVVLVEGALLGLWRATKRGRRLVVAVEALDPAVRAAAEELAAEAERLAPWRGAERAEVAWQG